jgi:hypothetical protein
MNNDDFRALIQLGGRKTTREIAREAVEREFRKRNSQKRRRNCHDGASSSDDDNHVVRHRSKESNTSESKDDLSRSKSNTIHVSHKYRDRARERREGIIPMSSNTTTITVPQQHDIHDHNDIHDNNITNESLTRDELVTLESEKLFVPPSSHQSKKLETSSSSKTLGQDFILENIPQSASDAKKRLVYWKNKGSHEIITPLGRSILQFFLQQVYPNIPSTMQQESQSHSSTSSLQCTTPAGMTLQRTCYKIHPTNFRTVWTSPEEHISMASIISSSNHSSNIMIQKGIFTHPELLQTIVQKLKSFNSITPDYRHGNGNNHDTSSRGIQTDSSIHDDPSNPNNKNGSDDDDIFDDVGDYVPDFSSSTLETKKSCTQDPTSVFANLLPNHLQEANEKGVELLKDSNQILQLVRQAVSRRHNSEKPKNLLSSYEGRYGEDEMDVDFDGTLEFDSDHEDDKAKKKKKKKKISSDHGS